MSAKLNLMYYNHCGGGGLPLTIRLYFCTHAENRYLTENVCSPCVEVEGRGSGWVLKIKGNNLDA